MYRPSNTPKKRRAAGLCLDCGDPAEQMPHAKLVRGVLRTHRTRCAECARTRRAVAWCKKD